MNLAAIKCSFAESFAPVRSVDSQIRAFLAGEGEGEGHGAFSHKVAVTIFVTLGASPPGQGRIGCLTYDNSQTVCNMDSSHVLLHDCHVFLHQ